jgi:hypothetical protein
MLALTHHFDEPVASASGTYLARVYAGTIEGGRWGAWLIFFPVGGGTVVSTDRETTVPSMAALSTWAGGLTHVYLEGALQRALALSPDAEFERELDRLERLEIAGASAELRAESLEAAASAARDEAQLLDIKREYAEERVLATAAETANREAQIHESAAAASRRAAHAADKALRARKKK